MKAAGELTASSSHSFFIRVTNKAHERAWQFIDLSGLNSMSVNPAYWKM
jgi:hypothetical protein